MEDDDGHDHGETPHIQPPANNVSVNSTPSHQLSAPPGANASSPPYIHPHPPAIGFPMSYPAPAATPNQQFSASPVANHLYYDQQHPSAPPHILPPASGFPMNYPASTAIHQQISAPPVANHLHYGQQSDAAASSYPASSSNHQTQVVIFQQFSAPPVPQLYYQAPLPWSAGLFDCASDMSSCCLTGWLPCVTFGLIAQTVDNGGATSCLIGSSCYVFVALLIGSPSLYSFTYRSKMRQQYMLEGSPCEDFMVHCFCEPCALCQEYREVQNRQLENEARYVQQQNGLTVMTSIAPRIEPMSR